MSFFKNYSNWPLVALKDIATLKRGYDLPTKNRVEGDVPIYAANGINGSHNEVKIKGPGVITGRSGTIGKVHFTEQDYWPLNTSLYVTDFHGNNPKWVFYMLRAFQLERFVEGAGVPTLNRNLVHDELIPLPPPEEQKRIAAILDKADAIRQKRKQAIELANEFLRSVFLDMFGDPVTNPKGWEVKNIVDLAAKEKHAIKRGPFGGALKKDIFVDSGYLVYEQYHALNNDFEFARYFIDESKYQELEAFKVSSGDIIISCSGVNLGRLAIVPEGSSKGIINQALLKVKLDESKMLNDMFVAIFTHPNFKNEFFGDHRGSGVPNFPPMSTFKEFGFIVPPLDEQKRYLKVVDKVRELKRKIVNSVSSADEQFNSLSQKAFSGQL
ncbi:hypothetical protein BTO00_12610 [Vibrio campbellii]|uniref:restriction endonuclease subunit S n=1 Tax=Vibrio campbellii TaxID=680 RepID=UPI000CF547BF|nr:restriction endonuclease subunit S [Vibrio campbellii]PQJ42873.1 hypothetical protein BTO00_12610 [Vibrio campbellii]